MKRNSLICLLSNSLFLAVFFTGFFLSQNKPLWLDEHWSLTNGSIYGASYGKILTGHNIKESNNSPLFYLTQKILCDIVAYDPAILVAQQGRVVHSRVPFSSKEQHVMRNRDSVFYSDPFSPTYLRLISIFFMALAPAVLFYYFSLRCSMWWGIYASLLCLSSSLFWKYGLEARPYIHFFTLTVLQVLIFLELMRRKSDDFRLWVAFILINILLAMTFTTSVFQIAAAGVCFGLCRYPRLSLWRVFVAFIIPVAIIFYYYFTALPTRWAFYAPVWKYYITVVPLEVVAVAGLFVVYGVLSWVQVTRGTFNLKFLRWPEKGELGLNARLLMLAALISLVYFLLLFYLKTQEVPYGQGGSPLVARHVINLVPIGIISMTVFSCALVRAFYLKWVKACLIILLTIVLLFRFMHAYNNVHWWIGF